MLVKTTNEYIANFKVLSGTILKSFGMKKLGVNLNQTRKKKKKNKLKNSYVLKGVY